MTGNSTEFTPRSAPTGAAPARPHTAGRSAQHAFTLVELLVVIVIIGILASLITVATTAALDKAHQTRIKVELDQIDMAFRQYKNQYGAHPPNFSVGASNPQIAALQIQRHMKRAFPRSKDTAALAEIVALDPPLNPAEAVVFWLGGFSADPEYPLTGPGGPLAHPTLPQPETSNLDDRTFLFEFDKTRLTSVRDPIPITIVDTSGNNVTRQVALFEYLPPKLTQPYVYFDTSRCIPMDSDPPGPRPPFPAWPAYPAEVAPRVRAYIQAASSPAIKRPDFVNPKSFQIIAAGTDDEWGRYLEGESLLYPDGPWTDQSDVFGPDHDFSGHADNLVNFSQGKLEDSQP